MVCFLLTICTSVVWTTGHKGWFVYHNEVYQDRLQTLIAIKGIDL